MIVYKNSIWCFWLHFSNTHKNKVNNWDAEKSFTYCLCLHYLYSAFYFLTRGAKAAIDPNPQQSGFFFFPPPLQVSSKAQISMQSVTVGRLLTSRALLELLDTERRLQKPRETAPETDRERIPKKKERETQRDYHKKGESLVSPHALPFR